VAVVAELTVASVMTTRLVTAAPETPLQELVARMAAVRVRAVPVVDRHRQPVGVVSGADLAPRRDAPGGRARRRSAADLMTTPVRAVHADEPVSFAARLLTKAAIRRLFVVDWDSRLVGVVARRDLLRVYVRGDDELRTRIAELLRAAEIAPGAVDVRVDAGVAVVDGVVTRRCVAGRIVRMVRALPGVLGVRDNLRYLVDDLAAGGLRDAYVAGLSSLSSTPDTITRGVPVRSSAGRGLVAGRR
jgi:CBS domain-containing protein